MSQIDLWEIERELRGQGYTLICGADEAVYIPVQTKHRIQNNTQKNMVFIEIQTGDKLDEADIIRYEDSYGRA